MEPKGIVVFVCSLGITSVSRSGLPPIWSIFRRKSIPFRLIAFSILTRHCVFSFFVVESVEKSLPLASHKTHQPWRPRACQTMVACTLFCWLTHRIQFCTLAPSMLTMPFSRVAKTTLIKLIVSFPPIVGRRRPSSWFLSLGSTKRCSTTSGSSLDNTWAAERFQTWRATVTLTTWLF
jgi:hypothetical protein